MLTGHRSAWRRGRRSRAARLAVPLAIPMALGLTLGIVIAVSGNHSTTINPSAAAAAAAADAAPSFANGQMARHTLGDLATAPVDGTGAPISLTQDAAAAATTSNCSLAVPAHPLTARGLATPWQLGDGCSMANAATEGAFVEATILAPNGSLQVYNPLVINAGATPLVKPAVPHIARGSHVIIYVGFNGNNLVLTGRGAREGNCVDAFGQSLIGQVSACDAVRFYRAANDMIADGRLQVPAAGTAKDGQPCPTTRSFDLVDQDQSDNVVTSYLVDVNGNTAQNTAANKAALAGDNVLANGSDEGLISRFVDPAIGCALFTAPDITNPNGVSPSQAMNELSAMVNQKAAVAVVPPNDEMTLVGNQFSLDKVNVYRSLVDQPLLPAGTDLQAAATAYCHNIITFQPARNQMDAAAEAAVGSPVPAIGSNLSTFLGARLGASFGVLGCGKLGMTNPVTVTTDAGGVAIAVTYGAMAPAAGGGGGGGGASASASTSAAAPGIGGAGGAAPSTPASAPASAPASGGAGTGGAGAAPSDTGGASSSAAAGGGAAP